MIDKCLLVVLLDHYICGDLDLVLGPLSHLVPCCHLAVLPPNVGLGMGLGLSLILETLGCASGC